jgi:hypothetical protein
MAVSDGRRFLPYSNGISGYLIVLGIVAVATVAACYAGALALLPQPARGLSANAPPRGDRRTVDSLLPGGALALLSQPVRGLSANAPPRGDRLAVDNFLPGPAAMDGAHPRVGRKPTTGGVPANAAILVVLSQAKTAPPQVGTNLRATPQNETPRPVATASSTPAAGTNPTATARLTDADVAALTARGDDRLRVGDVASARLYYERAADAGGGPAALRMAATFDPTFLSQIGARSMAGDPTKARYWYRRAHQLGAAEGPPPMNGGATEEGGR